MQFLKWLLKLVGIKNKKIISLKEFLELSKLKYDKETFTYYAELEGIRFWNISGSNVWQAQKEDRLHELLIEIIKYMETVNPYFYKLQMQGFDIGINNPMTRDILDS